MLQLKEIVKDYGEKDNVVHALKGVSLNFRDNEFVSILGQSGCGKTTMLNIVGGLDRYTSGDLIIDGISTKKFQDVDWDAYRNVRIGFIFQSYNLINHIDILSNVEMSLTLSGVSAAERKERALKALEAVGLKDQVKKRPNQLSGGQMQRVSIARALINNPNIILADEPTGALDSATSVQIMEILKDIAKDRLVIMVTHNPELAEQYSTRIVRLSDGEVVSDSNPFDVNESVEKVETSTQNLNTSEQLTKKDLRRINRDKKKKLAKTSMNFLTALKLSFTNLMTKKARTILTAVAGSIGIIGLSLVLAISNGFSSYVKNMEQDMLAGYPITIEKTSVDYTSVMNMFSQGSMGEDSSSDDSNKYPTTGKVEPANTVDKLLDMMSIIQNNTLSSDYVDHLNKMDKSLYGSIFYKYNMKLNIVGKPNVRYFKNFKTTVSRLNPAYGSMIYNGDDGEYQNIIGMTSMISFNEITGDEAFITSQYDCLYGEYPKGKNDLILIVDESNKIGDFTLAALGVDVQIGESYTFEELLNIVNTNPLKAYANNEYYNDISTSGSVLFEENDATELYTGSKENVELRFVGVFRKKSTVSYATMQSGVGYTQELVEYLLDKNYNSEIVEAQRNSENQYVLYSLDGFPGSASDSIGSMFGGGVSVTDQESALEVLGGSKNPVAIYIYPKDFDSKDGIIRWLDKWNNEHNDSEDVQYNDMAAIIASTLSQMIRIITIALAAFSSVSLVVSSFMIGIITYVSVVERTKEIGILRALGARKMDVSRVFNAETLIIGFIAGLIGVIITYILSLPINLIINWKAGMVLNLCSLNPLVALAMVALSMFLTLIAGVIPSRIAAKRDPVEALRSE